MKIHIIFVSLACVSMYVWHRPSRFPRKRLVTLPCRHVPSGMASSFPCPVSDYTHNSNLNINNEHTYYLCFFGMCFHVCVTPPGRRGFPERGSSHFHADTCLREWHHHLVSDSYTQLKLELDWYQAGIWMSNHHGTSTHHINHASYAWHCVPTMSWLGDMNSKILLEPSWCRAGFLPWLHAWASCLGCLPRLLGLAVNTGWNISFIQPHVIYDI